MVLPAAAVGVLVAALGSLVHAVTAGGLPVGLLLGLALTVSAFVMLGMLLGRPGVAAALVGWVVVVLVLGSETPGGDLIVSGSIAGTVWLFGGALLGMALAALPWPPLRAVAVPALAEAPSAQAYPGR